MAETMGIFEYIKRDRFLWQRILEKQDAEKLQEWKGENKKSKKKIGKWGKK